MAWRSCEAAAARIRADRSTGPDAAPRRPSARRLAIGGRALAALLIGAAALVGCGRAGGGTEGYRDTAGTAVRDAASEVATTRLVLIALRRHGLPDTSADDAVTTSERALSATIDTFEAAQPPRGADGVRARVGTALEQAEDAVVDARIVVRRHDRSALPAALTAIDAAAEALQQTGGDLDPRETS